VKAGWLFMKGRKDWKKRWFSLRGFTLYYYENEAQSGAAHEGLVDLNKGCEVVRQKAVKEDEAAKKQWPLKITVGDRKLFVRAASKKERHSWYLFLSSKIAHLNYIKTVEPTGAQPDTRLIAWFNSETVTDLHLDDRPIKEAGALALCRTLPAHDETFSLSLCNCSLDDAAIRHLADVLEKLNLKTLNLSKNHITKDGAAALAHGLQGNETLVELDLSHNHIGDEGLEALAAAVAHKPLLSHINLASNHLSARSGASIRKHLSDPARGPLPSLLLSHNSLGDAGAKEIAEMLKVNNTVTRVDLSSNEIGDDGAAALVHGLSDETSFVTHLTLASNNIGSRGALAFDELLKVNTTIMEIDLSDNKRLVGSAALSKLVKDGLSFPLLRLHRS